MENNLTSRKLAITIYEKLTDTKGRPATANYDKLVTLLTTKTVRETKDGKGFTPGRLKPDTTRSSSSVEFISMGVADLDNGCSLDDLRPFISEYAWIAYSSFKHTTEKPRFRLVFPLSRDVIPTEWPEFRNNFKLLIQGHSDPVTDDIGRFYWLHTCTAANEDQSFIEVNEGKWLEPDCTKATAITDKGSKSEPFENEFAGKREFPPASIEQVADKCAQIDDFRATGGNSEPVWYAALNVAKHCTDGEELAHKWSANYAGYTKAQTNKKMAQSSHGPTTCARFKEINPDRCKGCAFDGKVTSPIQLGYIESATVPETVIQTVGEDLGPQLWPKGYRIKGEELCVIIPDKDDVPRDVRISSPPYYLIDRIELDDGTFAHKAKMQTRNGAWREFEIPAKYTSDIRGLTSTLASYEVSVYNDKLMQSYHREFVRNLFKHRDEIKTFRQFGWRKDFAGFLIGDQFLKPDGRTSVRLSKEYITDQRLVDAGRIKGTKEEWTAGVTELYDRPNGLPYQYIICTQFGSPLVAFMESDEWNGIPTAFTSQATGIGKSSAAKIGINALCNSSATTVSNATILAVINRASLMNNLPVLIDEVTKTLKEPEQVVDVVYTFFNGRGKLGMTQHGRERVPAPPFKLNATMTGNDNLWSTIASAKGSSTEAVQMRLFEINLDEYPLMDSMVKDSTTHAKHHALAMNMVDNVYGVWADDYFRYITEHRESIKARLYRTAEAIIEWMGPRAGQERFFAYLLACTLVGGWVAKKIGAVTFDVTAIKRWAFEHVERLRHLAKTHEYSVEDRFSALLSELHGHILVTKLYDGLDTRRGSIEVPMLPLQRGQIQARLVLGQEGKERGKLYISVSAVDDWCGRNKVSPAYFKRSLAQAGLLRDGGEQGKGFDQKVRLAKGVPSHPLGQCRCFEVDFAAAQGYVEEFIDGKVVPLIAPEKNPGTVAGVEGLALRQPGRD